MTTGQLCAPRAGGVLTSAQPHPVPPAQPPHLPHQSLEFQDKAPTPCCPLSLPQPSPPTCPWNSSTEPTLMRSPPLARRSWLMRWTWWMHGGKRVRIRSGSGIANCAVYLRTLAAAYTCTFRGSRQPSHVVTRNQFRQSNYWPGTPFQCITWRLYGVMTPISPSSGLQPKYYRGNHKSICKLRITGSDSDRHNMFS